MYWSQNRPVISSCNVLTVGDTILDKLWICPQASDSIDGGGQLPTPAAHKPATAAYLTKWVNRTEGDSCPRQLPFKKAPFINFEMNEMGIV